MARRVPFCYAKAAQCVQPSSEIAAGIIPSSARPLDGILFQPCTFLNHLMGHDLTRALSLPPFPHLLIVEGNVSITTRLVRTLEDPRLHLGFDLCTSHRQAVSQLVASPYQVIIGNAHLAEMDDRLLLNRIDLLQGSVPLVITASPFEKDCARRVLEQGAVDLIPTPIDHEHAVNAILLAVRQSRVATLIASKENTLEKYREHRTAYPLGNEMDAFFIKTLAAIDASIRAYEKTLGGDDASAMGASNVAKAMEHRTRQQALARLSKLGRKVR